jgi:hypothetical protein
MGVSRELKGRLDNLSVETTNNRIITEIELGRINMPAGGEGTADSGETN